MFIAHDGTIKKFTGFDSTNNMYVAQDASALTAIGPTGAAGTTGATGPTGATGNDVFIAPATSTEVTVQSWNNVKYITASALNSYANKVVLVSTYVSGQRDFGT